MSSAQDLQARRQRRTLPDSVLVPLVITLAAACLFVGVRLTWFADGDVGRFVVAGAEFTDAREADLHVRPDEGYDGQFFFRLARDPFTFTPRAEGVEVDSSLRFQRIVYPGLAWVVSGGNASAVPWALVIVNVLALGALGGLGGAIARSSGRHATWGLLLPAYFGFVFTLSRDLSEIVEVAFLVAGFLALRRDRRWLAAGLLAAAVLTRETALFAVAGIALWRLFAIATRRARPSTVDATWIVPPLAFGAWQLVVADTTGSLPATDASANRFVIPGSELVDSLGSWFPKTNLLWAVHTLEVVTLLGVCVLAVLALRSTTAPMHERLAFVCLLLAALSVEISEGIWLTLHDFRMFADVYALAIIVLLGSRTRLVAPAIAVGLCTIGVIATSARFV